MFHALGKLGYDLGRGLLQIIYPAACHLCGRPLDADPSDFCTPCRTALTTDPHPACPRCAATVGPFAHLEGGCPQCRDARHHFDRAVRVGPYDGLLKQAIRRLKYPAGEGLAEALGALWAAHSGPALRALGADLIVPVPMYWRRRWIRGYNQSEVLARALASSLQLPCRARWLRRTRHTPLQTRQTAAGRRDNVRDAFRARPDPRLRGKTVLLVDDVLTTGSTCNEAALALRAAGAGRVVVAVLAHSRRPS